LVYNVANCGHTAEWTNTCMDKTKSGNTAQRRNVWQPWNGVYYMGD